MSGVAVYVDGFNVYFGLLSLMKRGRACYKWLDYWALAERLVIASPAADSGDELVAVKYFSAIVQNDKGKADKHIQYIKALRSRGVEVILGKYLTHNERCRNENCGVRWIRGEEKQSDVSIGLHVLNDAYQGKYDKAILVTGDSDQVPTISMTRENFSGKRIVLAYPPDRSRNSDLEAVLEEGMTMRFNGLLADCQLPDPTVTEIGEIHCPEDWR